MQLSSKTTPPASPACKSAGNARTCAAKAPCKSRLRSKLMRPEFQCATMRAGTSSGQTPSMTLYLAHKPMFDKRAPPVLSGSENTKYVMPKPRGGCEANKHLDKHEGSEDMGPLASMPGSPEDAGPLASMPGGPDEISMLAGESGHSAVALAFRLTLLLHTKASSGVARAQSASSAVGALRLRSVSRCMANRNPCKRSLSAVLLGDRMGTGMNLIKSLAWPQAGCSCC